MRGELEDHGLIALQRDRSNAASDSPQKIAMLKMANRLIACYRTGTRLFLAMVQRTKRWPRVVTVGRQDISASYLRSVRSRCYVPDAVLPVH
jgi:hypothetical protein